MSDQIDDLAQKFKITDEAGLRAAIWRATIAMAEKGAVDFRKRDTLDELAAPLATVIELLTDPLNGNRLAQHMRERGHGEAGFFLLDLVRRLELIRVVAPEAHRDRTQSRGPLPQEDLSAAAAALIEYWRGDLKRPYTKDHRWVKGREGLEPITEGERFVRRAVAYFAPERCGDELRTVLRSLG